MDMIEQILARHERAKNHKGQFNDLWESVSELLDPRRSGYTSSQTPGSQKTEKLIDTAPMIAARNLASAIDGMMKPKQSQWFEIETEDPGIMREAGVADWLYQAERQLFKEIYNPKARWIQATGEADTDLVNIGNAFVFCTESSTRDSLLFRTLHMRDVTFIENADGAIDTVHIAEKLSVNVAAQRWGEESLGEKGRDLLQNNKGEEKLVYLQAIEPRHDRDPRKIGNKNKPFRHVVIEVDCEHKVLESGFDEFPGAAARWDTTAGETYARGPGTLALPTTRSCQQIKKTILKAGHYAVDPVWVFANNMMLGRTQRRPGAMIGYDAVEAAKNPGVDPIKQLDNRANLPFGLEMLDREREEAAAAFYGNILNLPMQGPQMTATEIIQRREEFIRGVGSSFGRLETDYITPLVERAFSIIMRRSVAQGFSGAMSFPEPPDALLVGGGATLSFKFSSPIDKAKKQIESTQVNEWIFRVLETAKVNPEVLDVIDFDAAVRIDAEANDVPPSILLPRETVDAKRQHAAEQKAAMQNMQAGEQMASMGKDGGAAVKALADAMQGAA